MSAGILWAFLFCILVMGNHAGLSQQSDMSEFFDEESDNDLENKGIDQSVFSSVIEYIKSFFYSKPQTTETKFHDKISESQTNNLLSDVKSVDVVEPGEERFYYYESDELDADMNAGDPDGTTDLTTNTDDVTTDNTADTETTDAETSDTETTDAETSDTETTDAETSDTETTDSETSDTETTDAETSDTETTDAETSDTETTDAETSDTETTDAETSDTETTDTETPTETTDTETPTSETDTPSVENSTITVTSSPSSPTDNSTIPSSTSDESTVETDNINPSTTTEVPEDNRPELIYTWDNSTLCIHIKMNIQISIQYETINGFQYDYANITVPRDTDTTGSSCYQWSMSWPSDSRRLLHYNRNVKAQGANRVIMTFNRDDLFSISSVFAEVSLDNYSNAKDSDANMFIAGLVFYEHRKGVMFRCVGQQDLQGANGIITFSNVEIKALAINQEDTGQEEECTEGTPGEDSTVDTLAIVLGTIAGIAALVALGFAAAAFVLRQKRRRENDHQTLVRNYS